MKRLTWSTPPLSLLLTPSDDLELRKSEDARLASLETLSSSPSDQSEVPDGRSSPPVLRPSVVVAVSDPLLLLVFGLDFLLVIVVESTTLYRQLVRVRSKNVVGKW